MPLVPSFSIDVEATAAGARDASERLGAFAVAHEIGTRVRDRLSVATQEVVGGLARADGHSDRIVVEADIDQGDLQVVFTRRLGSREAVDETRAQLARLRESCDGFSARRADSIGIEVWLCFSLG